MGVKVVGWGGSGCYDCYDYYDYYDYYDSHGRQINFHNPQQSQHLILTPANSCQLFIFNLLLQRLNLLPVVLFGLDPFKFRTGT